MPHEAKYNRLVSELITTESDATTLDPPILQAQHQFPMSTKLVLFSRIFVPCIVFVTMLVCSYIFYFNSQEHRFFTLVVLICNIFGTLFWGIIIIAYAVSLKTYWFNQQYMIFQYADNDAMIKLMTTNAILAVLPLAAMLGTLDTEHSFDLNFNLSILIILNTIISVGMLVALCEERFGRVRKMINYLNNCICLSIRG
jgi:hypothetical protein